MLVSDLLGHHPAASVRLLLLNRPWQQTWDFRPVTLLPGRTSLIGCTSTAGTARSSQAAAAAVTAALVNDLDVPAALAIGEESGGDAARLVLRTLALD